MAQKLREWLSGSGGKVAAIVVVVLGTVLMLISMRNYSRSEGAALTRGRAYICAETGKTFDYKIKLGDTFPVLSPHSGKRTGYQAEACYWTADGKIKAEPTYVLLNKYADKSGPTFCPDCGRLVREMNDPPIEGAVPPPTAEEVKSKRIRVVEDQ